jgi:hypothetical protein
MLKPMVRSIVDVILATLPVEVVAFEREYW